MSRDATYPAGSNYQDLGGSIWVIGGQLIFDCTSAITATVTGANIVLTGIPTSDPAVTGALWADAGALKLSAGV